MTWRSKIASSNKPREQDRNLAMAYRELFKRGELADMVLADLAAHTGFYAAAPVGTPNEALQFNAGQRDAFARIFHFLTLSEKDMQELEIAARQENEHFTS